MAIQTGSNESTAENPEDLPFLERRTITLVFRDVVEALGLQDLDTSHLLESVLTKQWPASQVSMARSVVKVLALFYAHPARTALKAADPERLLALYEQLSALTSPQFNGRGDLINDGLDDPRTWKLAAASTHTWEDALIAIGAASHFLLEQEEAIRGQSQDGLGGPTGE